jgi:hypothetical protein
MLDWKYIEVLRIAGQAWWNINNQVSLIPRLKTPLFVIKKEFRRLAQ